MTRATEDQVKKKSFAKIGPRLKKGTTYTVDRLKSKLIHEAKVKQSYSKVLKREAAANVNGPEASTTEQTSEEEPNAVESTPKTSLYKHRLPRTGKKRNITRADRPISVEESALVEHEREETVINDGQDPIGPHIHPSRLGRTGRSTKKEKLPQPKTQPKTVGNLPTRDSKSQDDIEAARQRRQHDREAWNRKNVKGQPNLNSRIGVLLGKIERQVGYKS